MDVQAKLFELRDEIRLKEKTKGGKSAVVCNDAALSDIAKYLPRTKEELLAIEGVGKTFVEKYGDDFLNAVNEYYRHQAKICKANSSVINTLKELEKKLVNLNKANKLLYIPKPSKSVIDLYEICDADDVIAMLFGRKRRLKLCDLQTSDLQTYKINESNYKKLTTLMREVNRDFREKGSYDLYIGYPFVKGVAAKENFEFNAPLVLFPVLLVKEMNYYVLSKDDSRDIMYNNSLILALNKFNNIRKELPNNVLEDISEQTFIGGVKNYFASNGMSLDGDNAVPVRFDSAVAGVTHNTFEICGNTVIGKFSAYSSGIQKDVNEIVERMEINDLLKDLLQGVDDIDMYGDDLIVDSKVLEQNDKIQERELKYINELNSTQENILIANSANEELVIQGPPGTGKSQVITSLIASAVLSGKNVMMVSEKKSALDVVYSRLGELCKFAVLIDDVNNKDAFYSQLKGFTSPDIVNEVDYLAVSTEIDRYMYALTIIADKMCDSTKYGIEVYKLYQLYPKWKLDDNENVKLYKTVNSELQPFRELKYSEIAKIYSMYRNSAVNAKLSDYLNIVNNYPIIKQMRENLPITDIIRYEDSVRKLIEEYKSTESLSIFQRGRAKKKIEKEVKPILEALGLAKDKEFLIRTLDGSNRLSEAMGVYARFIDALQVYDKLTVTAQDYFKAIFNLSQKLRDTVSKANELAMKYIVNEYLADFESENRTTLHNINNYNGVLNTLSRLLEDKVRITKRELNNLFGESAKFINASKRKGDIRRVIDSKRRWSVKKFTDKFSYELLHGIKVWLLTPEVVSEIMPLMNGLFDLVIFDEASQMYIEKAIPSIFRAKSVVIAGDSKQLRPNNLGAARIEFDEEDDDELEDIAALEEESLLDVARFKYPPVMLDFHYRSRYEELIAFSNYAFYGGKLNVAPNPVKAERPPIEVIDVKNGLWQNRQNAEEAKQVVSLLKEILKNRQNNETLGVITFNSQQRDLIMDYIDEASRTDKEFYRAVVAEMDRKDNGEDTGLFIKNIENVQGDEREIIIFSIGYAKNSQGKIVKQFGWLNQRGGENRLNVAVSRAKSKVIVVKSVSAKEFSVDDCKNSGAKYLRKYLEYAEAVSLGDKASARQVLLSFVEDKNSVKGLNSKSSRIAKQLRHELERRGFDVEENVGIGNYNIDMAVAKDGKYLLGIEFDSSLYDISRNTRERDYHRWNYFRLRGWKMYRVWSSVWWDNPGLELGRILKRLK